MIPTSTYNTCDLLSSILRPSTTLTLHSLALALAPIGQGQGPSPSPSPPSPLHPPKPGTLGPQPQVLWHTSFRSSGCGLWDEMVDLGESSGLAKGLVAFPLACLSCFALYHFGMGFGVDRAIKISANVTIGVDESKPRLRSNNESKPQLRSSNESFSSKFLESIGVDLPHCALDVFLTLHKEIGGEDEHQCKALLISDDILLTSRVCSKFKFTFELPAFGTVEAVPHTSLNSKEEMVGSRLGLLEARNPMYAHFVDMPSRRTPMFLSYRSNPVVNGTDPRAPVFLTCGDKNEPIAHNFPVDGEMVPLHELAGVVPDDILWEEIDIYTAPMLRYKSHRWWTKPVTLEEEDEAIRKMISHYRGPPGSISVPDAHPSYESAASALFEVVDPRGHRNQDCFKLYFLRYRFESPFSRMHFFDWLDFGNGKFLLEIDQMNGKSNPMIKKKKLSACLKKNFNHKTVHYFNEEERLKHKIYISPSEDVRELFVRRDIIILF
ncbi:hypothetical protein ACHAWF_002834 [Thalassiosira exigua]